LSYGKRDGGYLNPQFIAWAREPLLRVADAGHVPQ